MAARQPRGATIPRTAGPPRPWYRKDSPFIWARTTIGGRPWSAPTAVRKEDGDLEAFHREAAAAYLAECESRGVGRGGTPLPRQVVNALTTQQLAEAFIEHEERDYTGHDERRIGRYESDLAHVSARWERVELITPASWEQTKKDLHNRAKGPLGSRSIAHLANTLRHFLRYCRDAGVIATVPEIKSPSTKDQKAEQRKRAALDDRQWERFLKALRQLGEHRAHRIYSAMYWSGLRQNELSALELSWVDWKAQTITVPAEHSKSGHVEPIPLHEKVRRVLKLQMADNGDKHAGPIFGRFDFHQANTPDLRGGLFGRACLKTGLAKLFPAGHKRAGCVDFAGLTPHHVTRHSAASVAADQQGTTLAEMMAMFRWRSSAMADRYLHPTVEAARRLSKRL